MQMENPHEVVKDNPEEEKSKKLNEFLNCDHYTSNFIDSVQSVRHYGGTEKKK